MFDAIKKAAANTLGMVLVGGYAAYQAIAEEKKSK